MKAAGRIWKLVVLSGWIILGVGLITLFVAAMQGRSDKPCRDVSIAIKGGDQHPFINKKDITLELEPKGIDYLRGRSVKEFNLKNMEDRLELNPWVRNAELYFDNNHVLRVSVEVNMPIARIFTEKGNSFYIDSSLDNLPLSERYSPRLPVFTGFPAEKVRPKSKDSVLINDIRNIAGYLNSHPFWMAQIDQIDITPERKFEMVPKVGDHIIVFGNGEDVEQRFHKLEVFYRQVMSKSGWNEYSTLDIQYRDQVVATKRNYTYHKSDTAVEKRWMKEWQKISGQMLAADTLQRVMSTNDSVSTRPADPATQPMTDQPSEKNPDPGKNKNSGSKGTVPAERQKPKALYTPGKKQT